MPTPLFDDLSVTIAAGERVALVGHSGSGKTTFVKLLQRLHEIQSRAHPDRRPGHRAAPPWPACARPSPWCRRSRSCSTARSPRTSPTLAPTRARSEIARAARLAHADGFIERLPQGYATLVGERGVKLSGGERQRVAIARAILADRPILVLDEATSSLDSEAEQLIQDALEHLMAGRTTLVIAHRLSTVRKVDRILVFERGRIVEQGPHRALLARPDGRYRGLYLMQAAGMEALPQDAA